MNEKYPTKAQLLKIGKWPHKDYEGLLEFIEDIWWAPNWGFRLSGKKVLRLKLSTGGWSGNEEIIAALRKSFLWYLYWQKTTRGGHYYFTIRKLKLAEEMKI